MLNHVNVSPIISGIIMPYQLLRARIHQHINV